MCSSVVSVRDSRVTSSWLSMNPSRRAATALHMYAPMLVVDVWTLVVPSALSTSAGSPESVSTIAVNESHVRCATSCGDSVAAEAPLTGTNTSSATSAAIGRIRSMANRRLPGRYAREPNAFRHVFVRGQAVRWVHPEEALMGRAGRRASAIAALLLLLTATGVGVVTAGNRSSDKRALHKTRGGASHS